MRRLELKIPPPLIGLSTAALMWLAARALPQFAFGFPLRSEVAIALAAVGLILDIAGIAAFLRAKTTVNPLKPAAASALVTTGVYRVTRNPMYAGMLALLLAWAAYLGSLAAFVLIPVYVLYLNRFQIAPEERALGTLFGPAIRCVPRARAALAVTIYLTAIVCMPLNTNFCTRLPS